MLQLCELHPVVMPAPLITRNGHHPAKSLVGGYTLGIKKAKLIHIVHRQGRPLGKEMSHWLNEKIDREIAAWEKEHGPVPIGSDLLALAEQKIGVRGAAVSERQKRVRGTRIPFGRQGRNYSKWRQVDWSLSNAVLAAVLGVSKQRVHQARRRYGPGGAEAGSTRGQGGTEGKAG